MIPDKSFQPYPDSGTLKATLSKTKDVSPDYWGELYVNLNDMTALKVENGLTLIKISGWKRLDKNGKTYLKIAVNRWVPEEQAAPAPQEPDFPEEDLPF